MDTQFTITVHSDYLHIDVTGSATYESALMMWTSIAQACAQYQIYKVLGEQFLMETVSTSEAFDHPALFKKAGITTKHRIAWVDKNPRTRETTAFIRDVLSSRSIAYGKLFHDVETAKRWLLEQ